MAGEFGGRTPVGGFVPDPGHQGLYYGNLPGVANTVGGTTGGGEYTLSAVQQYLAAFGSTGANAASVAAGVGLSDQTDVTGPPADLGTGDQQMQPFGGAVNGLAGTVTPTATSTTATLAGIPMTTWLLLGVGALAIFWLIKRWK